MDDRVYLCATTSDLSTYLGFPPENMSYHLAVGSGITPASGAGMLFHQTQPFPGAAWTNPGLPPHPTDYVDAPQPISEIYPAGCNTPMWSTLMRSTDEEFVMQRPGTVAPYGMALPVICPSDPLCRETFPQLNLSAPVSHLPLMLSLLGPGGLEPIMTNGKQIYAEYTHASTAINWHEDNVSANVPSDQDQGHQYHAPIAHFHSFRSHQIISPDFINAPIPCGQASLTHVVPIPPDCLHPSTHQGVPCTSPTVQYKVQGESRDFPQQFPQTSMGPAVASLSRGDSGRSPDALGTTKVPYLCKDCGKVYAQPQGLSRHRHEMHEPKLCTFCGAFKWGRRYLLKGHLKKEHPELDTDEALSEATGARHGATVTSRRSTCRHDLISEF